MLRKKRVNRDISSVSVENTEQPNTNVEGISKEKYKNKSVAIDEIRLKLGALLMSVVVWVASLTVVIIMTSTIDTSEGTSLSEDGVGLEEEPEDTTMWETGTGKDYDELPEVVNGFGSVGTPKEMTTYGDFAYAYSTELYVVTEQSASEIGVPEPGPGEDVVTDTSGNFNWATTLDNKSINVGYLKNTDFLKNMEAVYPDDYERLAKYITNEKMNWYKITVGTKDKLLDDSSAGKVVRGLFGYKVNPEGSVIIYNGGYHYVPADGGN